MRVGGLTEVRRSCAAPLHRCTTALATAATAVARNSLLLFACSCRSARPGAMASFHSSFPTILPPPIPALPFVSLSLPAIQQKSRRRLGNKGFIGNAV